MVFKLVRVDKYIDKESIINFDVMFVENNFGFCFGVRFYKFIDMFFRLFVNNRI